MPLRILVALVIGFVALSPVQGPALEMKPLPAFHLSASDGTPISSAELLGQDRWIVIYAAPGCRPCDDALGLLGRLRADDVSRRTLLIVGAPYDEARAYVRQALPNGLSQLRWYADDQAEAWEMLGLAGAPTLVGVRDGRVEWGLSGAPKHPERLSRLIRSWLAE